MRCDYFSYRDLMDKLFYGVPLTDAHRNYATEEIIKFLVQGNEERTLAALGIGIRIEEKKFELMPELNEVVKKRFVFISGERKGDELTIADIQSIGTMLPHGPYRYLVERVFADESKEAEKSVKAADVPDIAVIKTHCDWVIQQAQELKALFSHNAPNMVKLNITRVKSAVSTMEDSLEEIKAYLEEVEKNE